MTTLLVISDLTYSFTAHFDSVGFYYFTAECLLFTMRTSVTSCLWLNVFYYCQIVPAKHPLLILLKKNIKLFVYSALILDKFIFLYGIAASVVHHMITTPYTATYLHKNAVKHAVKVDFWLRLIYFLFSLCVMLTSSCATVLYLRRHMKNMEESSRSSPHLHSQMRVTITGIVQTLLYFLCSVWLITDDIVYHLSSADFDSKAYIICTVITLYSFWTNINLGLGQSIFPGADTSLLAKTF
ncbi:taste receptor type 2 member 119-like [Colossoma macropomum]|uniref:taste receptor type 2 member 119-like n=1 Tax=Colossoma macropomum TaxID=42526 RepID=UPI001864A4DA|nr:taste receptor type 2 member 119-like [Colossoma macropomum]